MTSYMQITALLPGHAIGNQIITVYDFRDDVHVTL